MLHAVAVVGADRIVPATMKDTIMANAEQALPRAHDLILYGASGFTGRLVAEHVLGTYGATGDIKWAMAGTRPHGRTV